MSEPTRNQKKPDLCPLCGAEATQDNGHVGDLRAVAHYCPLAIEPENPDGWYAWQPKEKP